MVEGCGFSSSSLLPQRPRLTALHCIALYRSIHTFLHCIHYTVLFYADLLHCTTLYCTVLHCYSIQSAVLHCPVLSPSIPLSHYCLPLSSTSTSTSTSHNRTGPTVPQSHHAGPASTLTSPLHLLCPPPQANSLPQKSDQQIMCALSVFSSALYLSLSTLVSLPCVVPGGDATYFPS